MPRRLVYPKAFSVSPRRPFGLGALILTCLVVRGTAYLRRQRLIRKYWRELAGLIQQVGKKRQDRTADHPVFRRSIIP